jgi:homocysteine S-methyltransferase
VETAGVLPSGEPLRTAMAAVDADAVARGYRLPAYYMLNCAHPSHFEPVLRSLGEQRHRLRGVRANASRLSHAELDAATALDSGNAAELGQDYARVHESLPDLAVVGGCCGTDQRHVAAIALALLGTREPVLS